MIASLFAPLAFSSATSQPPAKHPKTDSASFSQSSESSDGSDSSPVESTSGSSEESSSKLTESGSETESVSEDEDEELGCIDATGKKVAYFIELTAPRSKKEQKYRYFSPGMLDFVEGSGKFTESSGFVNTMKQLTDKTEFKFMAYTDQPFGIKTAHGAHSKGAVAFNSKTGFAFQFSLPRLFAVDPLANLDNPESWFDTNAGHNGQYVFALQMNVATYGICAMKMLKTAKVNPTFVRGIDWNSQDELDDDGSEMPHHLELFAGKMQHLNDPSKWFSSNAGKVGQHFVCSSHDNKNMKNILQLLKFTKPYGTFGDFDLSQIPDVDNEMFDDEYENHQTEGARHHTIVTVGGKDLYLYVQPTVDDRDDTYGDTTRARRLGSVF